MVVEEDADTPNSTYRWPHLINVASLGLAVAVLALLVGVLTVPKSFYAPRYDHDLVASETEAIELSHEIMERTDNWRPVEKVFGTDIELNVAMSDSVVDYNMANGGTSPDATEQVAKKLRRGSFRLPTRDCPQADGQLSDLFVFVYGPNGEDAGLQSIALRSKEVGAVKGTFRVDRPIPGGLGKPPSSRPSCQVDLFTVTE